MKTALLRTDLWDDDVFFELNIDTKLVYLLLISNPERGITNIYKSNDRLLSARSGLTIEQVNICKKQLQERELIQFQDSYIILKYANTVKPLKGRLTKQLIKKELNDIPAKLHKYLLQEFVDESLLKNERLTDTENNNSRSGAVPEPFRSRSGAVPEYDNDNEDDNDIDSIDIYKKGTGKPAKRTPSKNIDELLDYWEEVIGYRITSNLKDNREYCSRLLKENSPEQIKRMIQGITYSVSDQFAPRIANFRQLYKKWEELKMWGKREVAKRQQVGGVTI